MQAPSGTPEPETLGSADSTAVSKKGGKKVWEKQRKKKKGGKSGGKQHQKKKLKKQTKQGSKETKEVLPSSRVYCSVNLMYDFVCVGASEGQRC